MITEIDASLLEKIADLTGKPVGAFNIRKDGGCEARQSTEHIAIDPQPEGKSGIIIRIKDGTKGEQCHIPVIISKSGVTEMVYNDFYVGENCDVDIVAGCGIHNSGSSKPFSSCYFESSDYMEIANETLPKSIEAKEVSALFCRARHASGAHILFERMLGKKRSTRPTE